MGSVCCVPARKQSGGQERWPADPAHWRSNGDLSPRWDGKSFPEATGNLYRSSLSSSSRGSRRGSSRIVGHQRAFSGGIFSPDPSPSSSFRASHLNPLSSCQVCPLVDLAPLPLDSSCSPCTTITSSKEGTFNTPESRSSLTLISKDCPTQPSIKPVVHNSGGSSSSSSNSSFVSKFSKTLREKPHKCGLTNVGSSRANEGAFSSTRRSESGDVESLGGTTSDWSMVAFSELVASSRRDRLRWMSDGSGEDLVGLAELELAALERIKAAGYASTSVEAFVCGLCSRWLSQRSPLSSHKMVGNLDPPSVGVLACGHVFHADCLEQATSESERQDPPCPQCLGGGNLFPRRLLKSYSLRGSTTTTPVCAKNKQLSDDPESGLRIFSSASQERDMLPISERSLKTSSRKFSLRGIGGSSKQASSASSSSSSSTSYASGSRGTKFSSVSPEDSPTSRRRRGYLKW
ncbi:uncharacterized protein LOC112345468 [Selaginella moellendorffii]|nr:uncharacterized protein LOC112345468 [Selaginella moellendorffii]|eukprot:XP_024528074.1 uncharacterized protein LOC112345468 [Selaginella moellendorffii]